VRSSQGGAAFYKVRRAKPAAAPMSASGSEAVAPETATGRRPGGLGRL